MKEETRERIRSHAELIGVAFMVIAGLVAAFIASFLFPNVAKTVVTAGVAVSVLAFAGFYEWARFSMAPGKSAIARTHALFQRIILLVVVAWCVGVTLLVPNVTAAKRNGIAIVGGSMLFLVGWLRVRNWLLCPRCGTDFKKDRIAKLGRWSLDTRGTTELWDACPHCGVSFNEPYR
jgi:hypothetical protein